MGYNQTMEPSAGSLSQIRTIDNSRRWLPFATTILLIFLVAVLVWFFTGGSFRLYASVFFTFYHLTHQIWISVILIGISQNLIFLPLRFISLKLSASLKDFEDELDKVNSEKDQYFLFSEKVKKGDPAVVFYIFNFVLNAIAFFSAGRIFIIDFYTKKLNPALLYAKVPYPTYPLKGTIFKFPFFRITDTIALDWSTIFLIWAVPVALVVVSRLLWRLVKFLLKKNKKILSVRINYNHLLLKIGGFSGTIFLLSLFVLRHLPSAFASNLLLANLTRPNPAMNLITAIGTFLTTLHAGYTRQKLATAEAIKNNIPAEIIARVSSQKLRQTVQNALILGAGAYFITSQIPSAFELSVATFEILYILSPYTLDLLLKKSKKPTPVADTPPSVEDPAIEGSG